jgi:aminopeptidase N
MTVQNVDCDRISYGLLLFLLLSVVLFAATKSVHSQPAAGSSAVVPIQSRVYSAAAAPRQRAVDFTHLRLECSFRPNQGTVSGTVYHSFSVLRDSITSIEFDAIGLDVAEVLLNNKPAAFTNTDSMLLVRIDSPLHHSDTTTIAIRYTATPKRGIYFIGFDDSTGTMRRQIWTQGQATDHRYWIPMFDSMNDKVTTEVIATVQKGWRLLSNGALLSVDSSNPQHSTWHYRLSKPHAPYLLTIVAGEYNIQKRKSASGVPMDLYYYPDQPEKAEPTYRMSAEAMDYLERVLAVPYPWGTYAQVPVANFIFGAMENTTATTFGDFYHVDVAGFADRSYVNTNVHELTHQWFGNLITARSSAHLWLQESFATFYPHALTLETQGIDAYHWSRRQMARRALEAGTRDRFPIVHPEAGSDRIYPKGAFVLDMMRTTFGTNEFNRCITHFLKHHQFSLVETNDLYQSFQDTLGISPSWFFDQWLYSPGEPQLTVSTSPLTEGQNTTVTIRQTHVRDQLTGVFQIPIVIEQHYEDAPKDSVLVWITSETTNHVFPARKGAKPHFVVVDPGSAILKSMLYIRSAAELFAQAKHAPLMIDRYDALVELEHAAPQAVRIQAFAKMVAEEARWQCSAEMYRQLANVLAAPSSTGEDRANALTVLRKLSTIQDAETIKIVMQAAKGQLPVELVVQWCKHPVYSVAQAALQNIAQYYPQAHGQAVQAAGNTRGTHERVAIARLELETRMGRQGALDDLEELAGSKWEFITRQNAMQAIKRLGILRLQGCAAVLSALWNHNTRLSATAKDVLQYFAQQPASGELIRTCARSEARTTWQLERVRELVP